MTEKEQNKKITYAAFDFDGTMTLRNSLIPFLEFVSGKTITYRKLILAFPEAIGFVLGLKSRQDIKERILKLFFQGIPIEHLKEKGEEFGRHHLQYYVLSEAMRRFSWHKKQGHHCILISANLDLYLEPWGRQVGFEHVIASKVETDSHGLITGKLVGKNCWGPEKVRRLIEVIGPANDYNLYAYGDSRGDKELLELANHSFYRHMPQETV